MNIRRQMTLIFTFTMLLFTACAHQPAMIGATETTPTADAALVEETVYKEVVSELYPEGMSFWVLDTTSAIKIPDTLALKGLSRETANDYTANNIEQYSVNKLFDLDGKLALTNLSKLWGTYKINDPQIALELDFAAIRADYPHIAGIMQFSKVGFDASQEQALVEITFYDVMNITCTEYTFVLLSKIEGLWEIEDSFSVEECS